MHVYLSVHTTVYNCTSKMLVLVSYETEFQMIKKSLEKF